MLLSKHANNKMPDHGKQQREIRKMAELNDCQGDWGKARGLTSSKGKGLIGSHAKEAWRGAEQRAV